jgi:hypothetical protein
LDWGLFGITCGVEIKRKDVTWSKIRCANMGQMALANIWGICSLVDYWKINVTLGREKYAVHCDRNDSIG